jgi:hypothetical protein
MTVVLAIVPQDTQSEGAIVPSCPITGCSAVLSHDEITRIIERGYHEKLHESKDFTSLLQGKTSEQLKDAATSLIFQRDMIRLGLMKCPTCVAFDGRPYWFDAGVGGNRIVCPNVGCGTEFCRSCYLSPYHYHCTCADVVRYTRAWTDWCDHGRNPYVDEMHAHDLDYASRMADYQKAKEGQGSDELFNLFILRIICELRIILLL